MFPPVDVRGEAEFLQPFTVGLVFHTGNQLSGPLLDFLKHYLILFELRGGQDGPHLQTQPHQSFVELGDYMSTSAGNAVFNDERSSVSGS